MSPAIPAKVPENGLREKAAVAGAEFAVVAHPLIEFCVGGPSILNGLVQQGKQIEKNLFESADHFFGEWFGRMGWIHKVRVLGCTAGSSGVSVLLTLVVSGCQRKFRCRLAASGSERVGKYVERD